jgi:hypothetical protein
MGREIFRERERGVSTWPFRWMRKKHRQECCGSDVVTRRQGLGSRASLLASLACLLRWLCSLLLLLLLLPQHEGVHTHMWAGGRDLLLEASVGVMRVDVRKLVFYMFVVD